MNHRRKHTRGKHTRENSSEWRYPQVEKGDSNRSKVAAKRWVTKANDKLEQYYASLAQ